VQLGPESSASREGQERLRPRAGPHGLAWVSKGAAVAHASHSATQCGQSQCPLESLC
jgi:hypothetical protein